jgi:dTDP-4-dehydrorhamnose reductase
LASRKPSTEAIAGRPILVAGKSGQLACCLRDEAAQRGVWLATVGRPDLDLESSAGIDDLVAAIAPSAIINAAAYTAVDRAEAEPECASMINRDGAARLASAAKRRAIPFIHVSTDYVFGGDKLAPYQEADIPAPQNAYGRSKREGEIAVLDAYPRAVVIRTSWLYSPYGHNFVRTMLRLSATQTNVRVVNDQRGTPTSASDLANGLLDIVQQLDADRGGDTAGIYHLAGQGETTWYGFAEAIFASLARRDQSVPRLQDITTDEYPTPAKRPQNSCLDSDKAGRVFGVRLAPWQASLERCLDRLAVQMESPAC